MNIHFLLQTLSIYNVVFHWKKSNVSKVVPQITTLLVRGFLFNSSCNRLPSYLLLYEVSQVPLSSIVLSIMCLDLTSNRIWPLLFQVDIYILLVDAISFDFKRFGSNNYIKDERLPTCKKFSLRSPVIDGWFTTQGNFDGIGRTKVLIPSSGKVLPQVSPSDSYSYFILFYVCCKISNFFFQVSLPLNCTLKFK